MSGRPPLPSSFPKNRSGFGSPQTARSSPSQSEFPPLLPSPTNQSKSFKAVSSSTSNNMHTKKKSWAESIQIIDASKNFILKLPDEVLIYVLAQLDPYDLVFFLYFFL
jgi:hypothetical protein